jgi:molybdopterin synthase catalytic subunit
MAGIIHTAPSHWVEVTGDPLDHSKYVEQVADPGSGAIATFVGVTRNTFQGRAVLKLEYEAYVPMAVKKLEVSTCPRAEV